MLVAGALLAGGLSACTGGGEDGTFRLGSVGRADVSEVVEAPATVSARATAVLRSPAEGTIKRLSVADGDRVREGEVLARIASPTAREQLAQAREADRSVSAGAASVPAGLDISEFQRRTDRSARDGFAAARKIALKIADPGQRALVLAGITRAQAQYRTASAAARSAVARLNAGLGSVGATMSSITAAQRVQTRAAVRAAERTVEALTIKAPFDGVIGLGGPAGGTPGLGDIVDRLPQELQSQGGGLAGLGSLGGGAAKDASAIATGAPVAGGDAVITVTDVSKLSLSADVDETDVLQVDKGVQADVEFDAVQGGSYKAEVTGIGVTPKESNGGGVTYKVTLSLGRGTLAGGGTAPRPKPGMSAVVKLRVRDARNVLSVPSSAIVSSGRESVVWVVSGGRTERRVVALGAQGDATVQVTRGLKEGERIVVRGADSVEQGQELNP